MRVLTKAKINKSALFCFTICLIIFYMPTTNAARFSGGYLLHLCASDENGKEIVKDGHTACQAYIAGILDYHALLRSLGTAPSIDFCVPADIPMNTLQNQIYSYIFYNQNQHNSFIAVPGVALGLYGHYPCN